MTELFQDKFAFPTVGTNTDAFVNAANAHIDATYAAGKKVGESFFHAVAAYLSDLNTKQRNGGPFGAVIVRYEGGLDANGKGIGKPTVIGVGANHVVPHSDPSAHAEMEAYRDAAKRAGAGKLKGAVLYTSCECCPMCLSIANGAGIAKISYTNTRVQAEAIDFSDKLQYDMFALPRAQQMTLAEKLTGSKNHAVKDALGAHGAVVLDDKGQVFATGDADTTQEPTGVASINAIRRAVKKYATQVQATDANAAVFCLPEGFTLVCRDIPHPAGLITADWARMLRKRDSQDPTNPALDSKTPDPLRIIHMTTNHEELVLQGACPQAAALTYQQPNLPDDKRAVRTEHYSGPVVARGAHAVFARWGEEILGGRQVRY